MVVLERRALSRLYPRNANMPTILEEYKFPRRADLRFTLDDSTRMKRVLMQLAANGNNDSITSKDHPPSYLMHQMQVITVAEELMKDIDPHATVVVAGAHDLGRSRSNNESHIPIGYDIALSLNLPKEIANITLLHHQWGLGIEPFGSKHFDQFATIEESGSSKDKIPYLDEWKKSLGTNNDVIFLASIATLIADNSKGKTFVEDNNGAKIPIPFIAFFDKQQGLNLIKAQINKESYKLYSKTHWRELAGMTFVLNCIEYFEQITGVSYQAAIHHAIDRYKNEVEPELFRIWKEIY